MTASSAPIGVVGLGLMGTAITERLLEFGWNVRVWNRTREKAEPFLAKGAQWSDRPFLDCDRIIVSLFSSDVVNDVLTPWLDDVRPGQIVIDTTTGDPEDGQRWATEFAARGAVYLDAPISGSSEVTRRGEATVIISGDEVAYRQCQDVWPMLGKNIFHVGSSGAAARMKLVSNLVLGLNRAAVAEGLVFAEALGLDLPATLQVLLGSAAYSRQMETKGPKMIAGDFAVQARLSQHLKDVRLMLRGAEATGCTLSLTETHRRLLEAAERLGFGDADNSAVIEAMRHPET